MHSTMAGLVRLAAAYDTSEGWAAWGARSAAHWLSWNAGFSVSTGAALVRVGHALDALPAIAAAFAEGTLSFDKVRMIAGVATPDDEDVWLELAVEASGAQLARICSGYRRAVRADDDARAEQQSARRGLWSHWDDDGVLHLDVALPPDDGALVLAAIERVAGTYAQGGARLAPVSDPADHPGAARRADALVALCERAVAHDDDHGTTAAQTMVVHVDVGVLTGEHPEGRCEVDGGPSLSARAALRLGCDATLATITERNGLPIDAGRARRSVPTRLRRAVQARDGGCRFPGCGGAVGRTHVHHITHWAHGGRTDLANCLSLCGFHHRRLHDGIFDVRTAGNDDFVFETADGRRIDPPPRHHGEPRGSADMLRERMCAGAPLSPGASFARDAGSPLDLGYTVSVIANAVAHRRGHGGPDP
jgi:hypothetical protein